MDLRQVSNKQKYDLASSIYDKVAYFMSLGQVKYLYSEVANALRLPSNGTVIELGCGPASVAPSLLAKIEKTSRIIGIDFSCKMIEIANQKKESNHWDNTTFLCMDMYDFTPENQVDTVLFCLSLTAIPDYEKAIEKALEMLKPNGQLLILDSIPLHQKWYHIFTNSYIFFKSLIVGAKPTKEILAFLEQHTINIKTKEMVGGVYMLIECHK